MRLSNYTIIIWMGLAQAGEPEPTFIKPVEVGPFEPHQPSIPRAQPIHPIIEPKPHLDPHDQSIPKVPVQKPTHADPIFPIDPLKGNPKKEPSISKLVRTYLNKNKKVPEVLRVADFPQSKIASLRAQYLETMEKSFVTEGVIKIPTVAVDNSMLIQKGVGPALVTFVGSLTEGLSFLESLSRLSGATDKQRKQFVFSSKEKVAYKVAKSALAASVQKVMLIIDTLHHEYGMAHATNFDFHDKVGKLTTEQVLKLSNHIASIDRVLQDTIEQQASLINLLNLPIQAVLLKAEIEITRMVQGLKKEAESFQVEQVNNKLIDIGVELTHMEKVVDQKTLHMSIDHVLKSMLVDVNKADALLEKADIFIESLSVGSSVIAVRYQLLSDQVMALKEKIVSCALQPQYDQGSFEQDALNAQAVSILQQAITQETSQPKKDYWKKILSKIIDIFDVDDIAIAEADSTSLQQSEVLTEVLKKSSFESNSELDYKVCIWASNKMGVMESKLRGLSALLKIKSSPLFIKGYKDELKKIRADFTSLFNSRNVEKCLNVIIKRDFFLQRIQAVAVEISNAEKENDVASK